MIGLERYLPSDRDTWHWHLATLADVTDMVALSERLFQSEIDYVFTASPPTLARNISIAVIKQWHNLSEEQVIVARDTDSQQLMAWAWLCRGQYMPYAAEELAEAKFVHLDLALPARVRITLTAQIIHQWQLWCEINSIPVLVSTTIRSDQDTFLRLHAQAGFDIRGSYAFKRITLNKGNDK